MGLPVGLAGNQTARAERILKALTCQWTSSVHPTAGELKAPAGVLCPGCRGGWLCGRVGALAGYPGALRGACGSGDRAGAVALLPTPDHRAAPRQRLAHRHLPLRLRCLRRPHRSLGWPQFPQAHPNPAGLRRDPETPQPVHAQVAAGIPHPGVLRHPSSQRTGQVVQHSPSSAQRQGDGCQTRVAS